ncbi:MAG TPA: glucoamylase family protein [Bryobacteraceae bacterium]|jgi:hypothetical protein|nr:glucoamylase family protein [Bryobacteraceae bacterium]
MRAASWDKKFPTRSLGLVLLSGTILCADTGYFQRTFFDNSITPDSYFYSAGIASAPSTLELADKKLPVETTYFVTPPNALRLHWTSKPGGGWDTQINLYKWRNRPIYFPADRLQFWCYSPSSIAAGDLPVIALQDNTYGFTNLVPLGQFTRGVPAAQWIQIVIPLRSFRLASVGRFDYHRLESIRLAQGNADGRDHTLILDEIRLDAPSTQAAPSAPSNLQIKAFERHLDLSWEPGPGEEAERYVIYRSTAGKPFLPIGTKERGVHRFTDFAGKPDFEATYKVKAQNQNYQSSAFSGAVSAKTRMLSDDELLTMVQEASFRYYWEAAHPASGMIQENTPGNDEIVATGASGFGIMAIVVGIERGFITRDEGIRRLLKITAFLKQADHFHGVWPHFMNGATGRRMPVFDMYDNGADVVETSFLMEGLLTARQYFKGTSHQEQTLYKVITELWEAVDWNWFRRTANGGALYWHWSPEFSWHINHPLYGWNEVMIAYLLAIASPAHSVPKSLYETGWAGDPPEFRNGGTYFGIRLALGIGTGGPLFFTHYSYMGFDPHGFRDKFTDYFEQNRNMALINNAYCLKNPNHHTGYSESHWGLTAVDGPNGYVPYEPTEGMDDGTIAPTGAISSFPYTPDLSMAALKSFYRELGDKLWDTYGFRDAFNLQRNWYSGITMGLNQAPMVVMIENYRSGLVWKSFLANPEIQETRRSLNLE